MTDYYPKAYREVIEILNFVPQESVNKIPKTMLETFKMNMDNDYDFTIDINKSFEKQELLDETKAILANIFKDYWATPYQKDKIETKEKWDRKKSEEEKRAKYNPDIFNKREIENDVTNKQQQVISNLPIEVKKQKFYYKIIKFFKKIFNMKGD